MSTFIIITLLLRRCRSRWGFFIIFFPPLLLLSRLAPVLCAAAAAAAAGLPSRLRSRLSDLRQQFLSAQRSAALFLRSARLLPTNQRPAPPPGAASHWLRRASGALRHSRAEPPAPRGAHSAALPPSARGSLPAPSSLLQSLPAPSIIPPRSLNPCLVPLLAPCPASPARRCWMERSPLIPGAHTRVNVNKPRSLEREFPPSQLSFAGKLLEKSA